MPRLQDKMCFVIKSVFAQLFIVSLTSCALVCCSNRSEKNNPHTPAQNEAVSSNESNAIVLLKESSARQTFLSQIEDWKTKHTEPSFAEDTKGIFPEITDSLLLDFVSSIDLDTLKVNNHYQKQYHFNLSQKNYEDSIECLDNISVYYDQRTKNFSLSIFNNFYVDKIQECSEHQTIYEFVIKNGKLTLSNISAAG